MSNRLRVRRSPQLEGSCIVPGDKSISHRALMFGAIAQGRSKVSHFLNGSDCLATAQMMRDLGIRVEMETPTSLVIEGRGLRGLCEPKDVLNAQNSGTTIRLMSGLLASQQFFSVITGSEQIRRRPMGRVISPLGQMGAKIQGRANNQLAPLAIAPVKWLNGILHELEVSSAQVKSAILLAGLYARDVTTIQEPGPSRDHSERFLRAMGADIRTHGNTIKITPHELTLNPFDMRVPSDPSSAAFIIAAALVGSSSRVELPNVSVNSTRTGLFDAVRRMGATLEIRNAHDELQEPVADLVIHTSELRGQEFSGEIIVRMIDELPILAVIATQAHGVTTIRDAKELKVKETNRIETTVSELRKMGAKIEALDDGFVIEGPTQLQGANVNSHGDHRLAMAMAIAGLCADGETVIDGADVTVDSFPGFAKALRNLGADITEDHV